MRSNARTIIEKKLIKVLAKTMRDAPKALGNEGQKAILENFATESYEGKKWAARKKTKKANGKPILIGRTRKLIGAARRSYKGYFKGFFYGGKLKWSIDGVVYAKIHNNGGVIKKKKRTVTQNFKIKKDGSFRYAKLKHSNFQMDVNIGKHKINMPKRQFIGLSPKFINRLKLKFNQILQYNLR